MGLGFGLGLPEIGVGLVSVRLPYNLLGLSAGVAFDALELEGCEAQATAPEGDLEERETRRHDPPRVRVRVGVRKRVRG